MDSLHKEFSKIVESLCVPYFKGIEMEVPSFETPDPELGDLALPCFTLSKSLRKSPVDIAAEAAAAIDASSCKEVKEVLAMGGYVNFIMDPKWAAERLPQMLSEDYSRHPSRGMTVVLEHTSANPTDRLHVGRARNPIIGDTLARICRQAGYDVQTQYYVDDMGRQAATLAYGESLWDELAEDQKTRHLGPYQYASALVKSDEKTEETINGWLHALESQSSLSVKGMPLQDYVDAACGRIMEAKIIPTLKKVGVCIDDYAYESSFVKSGAVEKLIERLKELPGADQDDNGAWYVDMASHGITGRSTRFFFTRGDGTSLYATRDIAYHIWKIENYDRIVNVLGEDHRLESRQVAIILSLLGQEKMPEVVFYAFVGLPEGKMSTRTGQVVYFDELLDEGVGRAMDEVEKRRPELALEKKRHIAEAVGISSVRYNIIRIQPEKKMVFKWEDALNFEGDSAPFIQYAYTRAASILEKAGDWNAGGNVLLHPSETALIKHLARLPDVVEDCAASMRPHNMAAYAHRTAVLFNQFYRDCPVLSEQEPLRSARLGLVSASKNALGTVLELLGLAVLEEM